MFVSFENDYILDVTACVDEFHECQDKPHLCEVSPEMRKDCPKTCGDCKMSGKCEWLITPLSLPIKIPLSCSLSQPPILLVPFQVQRSRRRQRQHQEQQLRRQ